MSEQPKNPHSEPPPATDEIDAEWNEKPAPKGAAAASTDKKPASKVREHDEEEEEDEDDDEEEDEDEEEDDDDEEEDEDEEEDDHKGAHSKSTRPTQSESGADEMIPDWGPWAVLGVLVVIGLVGGLGGLNGLINIEKPRAEEPAQPTSKPAPSAAAAARPLAKPLASARAAAAMDPADAETVEASHLLVAYQGSRRAAPTITRTKEEAKKRADEALAKAKKKGAEFEKVVAEYSDEPRAAERGGKLGAFTRRRMAKEFSDAAFALKPGELSGVVETPFGYHVILRTK
jgi:parvulin-like peptidyl-prolyl isomerase